MSVDALMNADIAPRLEVEDEISFMQRPEKIKTIKNKLGFYPQSNEEASRAMALIGHEVENYPALMYLNEIYIHQRKYDADAPRTIRSVVRGFEEYAGNAINEWYYMDGLLQQLALRNPNSRTGFTTLFPDEDWQHDKTQIAIFSAMSRYLETDRFADTEENDRLNKKQLIDYTSGDERIVRIKDNLNGLRASSIKGIAHAIQGTQEDRFNFWTDQLEVSTRHLFARDAAMVALEELARIK